VCCPQTYDRADFDLTEFAFYINRGGRRSRKDFLVHWEGAPASFGELYLRVRARARLMYGPQQPNTHTYSHSSPHSSRSATSKRAQCPKSSKATTSAASSPTPSLHHNRLIRTCRAARSQRRLTAVPVRARTDMDSSTLDSCRPGHSRRRHRRMGGVWVVVRRSYWYRMIVC
jgi:hypothetical protein